jgi:hypothetical protein
MPAAITSTDKGDFPELELRLAANIYQSENIAISVTMLIMYGKIFKYFELSAGLSEFSRTMEGAAPHLIRFLIVVTISLSGFSLFGHFTFGTQLYDYSSMPLSLMALMRGLFGDMPAHIYYKVDRVFGPLFFLIYQLFAQFIFLEHFMTYVAGVISFFDRIPLFLCCVHSRLQSPTSSSKTTSACFGKLALQKAFCCFWNIDVAYTFAPPVHVLHWNRFAVAHPDLVRYQVAYGVVDAIARFTTILKQKVGRGTPRAAVKDAGDASSKAAEESSAAARSSDDSDNASGLDSAAQNISAKDVLAAEEALDKVMTSTRNF